MIPAKLDQFGHVVEKAVDEWSARRGVGFALSALAPHLRASQVADAMRFFVEHGMADRHDDVRAEMLNAAMAIVDLHGKVRATFCAVFSTAPPCSIRPLIRVRRTRSTASCRCSRSSWTPPPSHAGSTPCGSAWCCWWARWRAIWSPPTLASSPSRCASSARSTRPASRYLRVRAARLPPEHYVSRSAHEQRPNCILVERV